MVRRIFISLRLAIWVALCSVGFGVGSPADAGTLWKYSAQGSVLSAQGSFLDISGSIVLDGTVWEWPSVQSIPIPLVPAVLPDLPQYQLQVAYFVLGFELQIGNFNFFGGNGIYQVGNSFYFDIWKNFLGVSGIDYCCGDYFLTGSGDFGLWLGHEPQFFNSDGSRASVEDLFQAPPALIQMNDLIYVPARNPIWPLDAGRYIDLTLTRVAPIPEPEIYAMMLAGLGLIGWVGRRKKEHAAA